MTVHAIGDTTATQSNWKPSFGGHEKFVFRHAWLKKGVDVVESDPFIFTHDEALVRLGVGKNMVRSIRHWCLTIGLVEEGELIGRTRQLTLTKLGRLLLRDGGWDPYLEDLGTLWLIHWQLATNQTRALVWNIVFSNYYESEFSKAQLKRFVSQQLDRRGITTTDAMIEREVDTCLRTYTEAQSRSKGPAVLEESLACPLIELDLIRLNPVEGLYRFSIGPKATLPTAVFGFALLQFLRSFDLTQRTVAVDTCIYDSGSPGQLFKLDENSVIEYLEALEVLTDGGLRLQETAGLRQLYLHHLQPHHFDSFAYQLLNRYYDHHND